MKICAPGPLSGCETVIVRRAWDCTYSNERVGYISLPVASRVMKRRLAIGITAVHICLLGNQHSQYF